MSRPDEIASGNFISEELLKEFMRIQEERKSWEENSRNLSLILNIAVLAVIYCMAAAVAYYKGKLRKFLVCTFIVLLEITIITVFFGFLFYFCVRFFLFSGRIE